MKSFFKTFNSDNKSFEWEKLIKLTSDTIQ